MPDEPQISFGQALEGFQGQISVKFNGCHVAKNIAQGSNFFCGLCLMSFISVLVKLWRFQGQISVKVNGCNVAENIICVSIFFLWAMPDDPQISFSQALEGLGRKTR